MAASISHSSSNALVLRDPKNQPIAKARDSLEKRLNSLMQSSFQAQFADHQHFNQSGMGNIIVLVGTSTAGKTSIIKALKKFDPARVEDGGDIRANKLELKIIKQYCPEDYAILKKALKKSLDIPNAVHSKERSWKPGVSAAEILKAEEAIERIRKNLDTPEMQKPFENMEQEMFDHAFDYCRRGGKIVFDVLNIDALAGHILMRNFKGPMTIVLTFCPLKELSSRMEKRNAEAEASGELGNQRVGAFPLEQFSELFTQKVQGQPVLERISKAQAIKAYDENFEKGIKAARHNGRQLPPVEQIAIDKKRFIKIFLEKLGFKGDADVVEVSPRQQELYNLFIDTSKLKPEVSAKLILHGLN